MQQILHIKKLNFQDLKYKIFMLCLVGFIIIRDKIK